MKKTLLLFMPGANHKLLAASSFLFLSILTLPGCKHEDNSSSKDFELSITPDGREIKQSEALEITAVVNPVPDEPLTFEWETPARYGKINKDAPYGEVIETNSKGKSTILYSGTPAGNPGGTESIDLTIFNAAGAKLKEALVEVVVSPPDSQEVGAVTYEHVTPGSIAGREDVIFLTAWVFYKLPGFTKYDFTVKVQPGPGWSVGPVGSTFTYSQNNGLVDAQTVIQNYGSDIFDLKDDKWALLLAGPSFGNYNPNDPDDQADLDQMRQGVANLAQAVYIVKPH